MVFGDAVYQQQDECRFCGAFDGSIGPDKLDVSSECDDVSEINKEKKSELYEEDEEENDWKEEFDEERESAQK